MERPQPRFLTHLGNVHHVCHESKPFQLQLGDEGLEEHVDLWKQSREVLSAQFRRINRDRRDQWGPTVLRHRTAHSTRDKECPPRAAFAMTALPRGSLHPSRQGDVPSRGAGRAHLGTGLLYALLHWDGNTLQQLLKLELLLLQKTKAGEMRTVSQGDLRIFPCSIKPRLARVSGSIPPSR